MYAKPKIRHLIFFLAGKFLKIPLIIQSVTSELIFVSLLPRTELFVPTAFTPNGDFHNDLFVIKGDFINSFKMDVVNRWGEVLFTTNSIEKYWDGKFEGKEVVQGTYYYNITLVGQDKKTFVKQGTVEVIY